MRLGTPPCSGRAGKPSYLLWIDNTNPLYERAHQAHVGSVLADRSLTVEDKVTLMLMHNETARGLIQSIGR